MCGCGDAGAALAWSVTGQPRPKRAFVLLGVWAVLALDGVNLVRFFWVLGLEKIAKH